MKTRHLMVSAEWAGQRIDNYLVRQLKGVPKSRIYRAIRAGEVRANGGRIKATYRVQAEDDIRVPPLWQSVEKMPARPPQTLLTRLTDSIIFESDELLILNKPEGLPVHGGSGVQVGLIEALRLLRPEARLLELVHRLDRGTSGCLLIAKKRAVLVALHQLFVAHQFRKQYLALVKGAWEGGERRVESTLKKNTLKSGERMVTVHAEGKASATHFRPLKKLGEVTLVEAKPYTDRTHQIRVHAAQIGHPIIGDEKYGDEPFNAYCRSLGFKRLFLHAAGVYGKIPTLALEINICGLPDTAWYDCVHFFNASCAEA